jgi:hypothetical protein
MFSIRNYFNPIKISVFAFFAVLFSSNFASASQAILVCQANPGGAGYRVVLTNESAELQDANGNSQFFYHAEMAPGATTILFMGMNSSDELELPQTSEEVFTGSLVKAGRSYDLDCEILQGSLAGE